MEIKINIPKNEYVQPTEVREEVVQLVCEAAISDRKLDQEWYHDLVISDKEPACYICYRKGNELDLSGLDYSNVKQIRIRTCEMKAAFDAIQDAGYFIYGFYNITDGEHRYHFSTKPYFENQKAERVTFDLFID